MADTDRLAAALRYQQDMEGPVTMNPNIAAQGRKGRANMAPPTSVMDPRSRDYERRARETENFLIGADILAGALPFAPLAKGAAMAAGKYAGPELARGLENYMVKSGAVLPMDVWHGSPHRFPPTAKNPLGEFDPTKIGTGEGAQAYGVGAAYLAEAKDLAKHYRDVLAIDPRDSVNSVRAALSPSGLNPSGNKDYWGAGANSPKLDDIYFEMKKHPSLQPYLNDSAFKKDIQKIINGTNPDGTVTDEAINILRRLDKTMPKPSGQLYKVDLPDEHIAKMLDWDKPLSQQSELIQQVFPHFSTPEAKVLKLEKRQLRQEANDLFSAGKLDEAKLMMNRALAKEARMFGVMGRDEITGQELHMKIQSLLGEPAKEIGAGVYNFGSKATSEMLREMGIPGIRYLDQGSRAAGKGTSNFVVFDPAHMNIIGRE